MPKKIFVVDSAGTMEAFPFDNGICLEGNREALLVPIPGMRSDVDRIRVYLPEDLVREIAVVFLHMVNRLDDIKVS